MNEYLRVGCAKNCYCVLKGLCCSFTFFYCSNKTNFPSDKDCVDGVEWKMCEREVFISFGKGNWHLLSGRVSKTALAHSKIPLRDNRSTFKVPPASFSHIKAWWRAKTNQSIWNQFELSIMRSLLFTLRIPISSHVMLRTRSIIWIQCALRKWNFTCCDFFAQLEWMRNIFCALRETFAFFFY